MADPVFRHDRALGIFHFLWDDGEIVVPDASPDRLGRLLVEIRSPGGEGYLARDLVNILGGRDRWQIASDAARLGR